MDLLHLVMDFFAFFGIYRMVDVLFYRYRVTLRYKRRYGDRLK
jgi:hypothetical protein